MYISSHPIKSLFGLALAGAMGVAFQPATSAQLAGEFIYETGISGYRLPGARGIAVDDEGNAFVIARAYEDGHSLDVIVIKLSPEGDVLWTNYIDGGSHDYATDVAVGPSGDVYISGWTDSEAFPLVNAMRSTHERREAFLMRISSVDGSILLSTFLGGSFSDHGGGVAVNGAGEIYIAGYTESLDFPVTGDAIQSELNIFIGLASDVFITKLSPDGQQILYSTYLGGVGDDECRGIGLDAVGNIFVAGYTRSDDFPLVKPIQPQFAGGEEDLFVARIKADGSELDYSTYVGGEDRDWWGGMDVDAAGHAYITGATRSILFPTTPGAFQEQFVGGINACGHPPYDPIRNCEDGFVTKLAPDGSAYIFSTFLGGTKVDEARDVAAGPDGSVHVVGYTTSADFPPEGTDFGAEIFLGTFDSSGAELLDMVTIDSGSANRGNGVAVDRFGDVYFTGTLGVPADIYVAKIGDGVSRAAITGIEVVSGELLDGGVADVNGSDDQYVHTRSGFGSTLTDLHNMEMYIGATTGVQSATSIDLTFESRIDEPAGMAYIRLLNHNTQQFELVGQFDLGDTDAIDAILDIEAANYVSTQGDIVLSIKHVVFVPSLAYRFESWLDWVELIVE